MKKIVMNSIAALLFISTGSFAQTDSKKEVKKLPSVNIPTDPNVKIGKLENGLTYYIRNNGKPEDKVELRLAINAGSILENEDQQGLAHFVEHMNFNGTTNFEKNELVDYLQSIGVKFGADLNAYTGFDETVYILPIPSDNPETLEKGFQILEDWAHNALMTDKDIDEERGVVMEEYRLGLGPDKRMMTEYLPKLM
ncbi:MAG: insulinase family protein, partial [Gillisia sp.]